MRHLNNHHSDASARAMLVAVVCFCKMLHSVCVIIVWPVCSLLFSIRVRSCYLLHYFFLISWHIIYKLSALCSLLSKSKFLRGASLNLCIWRGNSFQGIVQTWWRTSLFLQDIDIILHSYSFNCREPGRIPEDCFGNSKVQPVFPNSARIQLDSKYEEWNALEKKYPW